MADIWTSLESHVVPVWPDMTRRVWPDVLGRRIVCWDAQGATRVTNPAPWAASHIRAWMFAVATADKHRKPLIDPYTWLSTRLWAWTDADMETGAERHAANDIAHLGPAKLLCDDLDLVAPTSRRAITSCFNALAYGSIDAHRVFANVVATAVALEPRDKE